MTKQEFCRVLTDALGDVEVTLDTETASLDSMQVLMLVATVHQHLGRRLEVDELDRARTIQELTHVIGSEHFDEEISGGVHTSSHV